MKSPAPPANPGSESSTILQRIGKGDKTAVKDCLDIYGNPIWALARKYTDSLDEAEAATQEIFLDIWRYARRCNPAEPNEAAFICLLARRRLSNRF